MGSCKVVNPITNVCGDLLYPGGADKDFYVGYISDLGTRISNLQAGDISSLSFVAYAGLRKMEGQKFSHNFGSETVVGAGKNVSFLHRATVKLITQSTADDVEMQRMAQATDMFIIYQNNNDQLFILAPTKGLSVAAGALQSTGVNQGDDVSDTLILEGAEKTKPLRFSISTSATITQNISYLDGLIR